MKGKSKERREADRTPERAVTTGNPMNCSLSWEKLVDMKNSKVQFLAGDGYKRLQIVEADEKSKNIHMICELGKITWPLRYDKLEEIHQKVHAGDVELIPYEIDRLIPTWGNFITGLLRYLGCQRFETVESSDQRPAFPSHDGK
jgi:hypothetical protein